MAQQISADVEIANRNEILGAGPRVYWLHRGKCEIRLRSLRAASIPVSTSSGQRGGHLNAALPRIRARSNNSKRTDKLLGCVQLERSVNEISLRAVMLGNGSLIP